MSEFQVVEAMLRQQRDYIGERFDGLEERANARFDKVEERLAQVEQQVRITNGTVKRHAEEILKLQNPDQKTAPFLTQSEAHLLRRAVGWSVTVGGAVYGLVRWVSANWSHLVPAVLGWVR